MQCLENLVGSISDSWWAVRDYNVIASADKKSSASPPNNQDMEEFNEALDKRQLNTINFDESLFTWTNGTV